MALTTVSNAGLAGSIDLTAKVTGTLPIANGGTNSTSTTYCDLTANVTGTMPAANGGTGATTFSPGKILQVQYFNIEVDQSTASTSYVATTLTDQITPSATDSKILIMVSGGRGSYGTGANDGSASLYRQIGGGGYSSITIGTLSYHLHGEAYGKLGVALSYLDSPSTTSAVDYTMYMKASANIYFWNSASSMVAMTLMEIGA